MGRKTRNFRPTTQRSLLCHKQRDAGVLNHIIASDEKWIYNNKFKIRT